MPGMKSTARRQTPNIYVVSRDTNKKRSPTKVQNYMFRVSNQIKKKLASGIGFISLVTFETRTEEEEDFTRFDLRVGVVLLPPAAPQQRAFARRACCFIESNKDV